MDVTRYLIFLFVLMTPVLAYSQPACSPDAAIKSATLVHRRQAELLKVKIPEMDSAVPIPLQVQIRLFKHALQDAVDTAMKCKSKETQLGAIQSELAKLLGANLPPDKPAIDLAMDEVNEVAYGKDLTIAVSTPANAPSLRAVKVAFDIACGDDNMLLLYEAKPNAFERVLTWQSNDYAKISGAFGDFFEYAVISPSGSALRVAVAHGTPWCTSRFSNFKIDLLAPSRQPTNRARMVWHANRGYSRGDFNNRLRTTSDGFELRVNAPASDPKAFERTVVYRYRVIGAEVTRVGPIATTGRGFVEEWIAIPWKEASERTSSDSIAKLKLLHETIRRLDEKAETYVGYEYGPVRACRIKGRYEIEMDADPGGAQYFSIREDRNGYTMTDTSKMHDERCDGPDLMQ